MGRRKRLRSKFEKFILRIRANSFGDTVEQRRAKIAHWEKNGMTRGEIIRLQILWAEEWARIGEEKESARAKKRKRRGPQLNPKDKPVIREVAREISGNGLA